MAAWPVAHARVCQITLSCVASPSFSGNAPAANTQCGLFEGVAFIHRSAAFSNDSVRSARPSFSGKKEKPRMSIGDPDAAPQAYMALSVGLNRETEYPMRIARSPAFAARLAST